MSLLRLIRGGFAGLEHRNFRLFWTGQIFSLMGTWMQTVAQSWLILQLTDSTFQVGLVIAIQFSPVLLLGLFGGVYADRWSKRRTLLITQSCAALQALLLAGLTWSGVIRPGHVMALAAFLGLVNSFDMPTRQAFVTEMVGRQDVVNAIALNSSAFNLARIVGPAIGGLLIAEVGVAPAFFINGVSFLAVLVALARIRESELFHRPAHRREGVWEGMRAGLRYVRATPVVYVATLLVGSVATFGMNFSVVLPAMARDIFRIGSSGFGFLMSSLGIGSLLAGLFIAFFRRLEPLRLMLWGATGFSVLELLFAFSPLFHTIVLSSLLLMTIGFCTICMTATANSSVQRESPDELRGRVMSVYVTIFAGSMPLGGLFAGTLARYFGAPAALGAGAVLSGTAASWAWWELRRVRRTRRAEAAPRTGSAVEADAASSSGRLAAAASEQVAGSSSGRVAGSAAEQVAGSASGRVAGRSSEQVAGPSSGRVVGSDPASVEEGDPGSPDRPAVPDQRGPIRSPQGLASGGAGEPPTRE